MNIFSSHTTKINFFSLENHHFSPKLRIFAQQKRVKFCHEMAKYFYPELAKFFHSKLAKFFHSKRAKNFSPLQ